MKTLYIVAAGAITALGHDARRTVASLRSGLDRFKETPFWGTGEEALQAAPIEGYAEGLGGVYRYEALALKALRPCLEGLLPNERERTVVFLGLPRPDRPGVLDNLAPALQHTLASSLDVPAEAVHPVLLGRASVFWSLKKAQELLQRTGLHACVVGGVDSLVNANSLHGLFDAGLLKEEWDGFIPGEAAAFIRVTRVPGIGCWGRPAVALAGVGTATETADGSPENPLVGVGVRAAFRSAMNDAGLPESEVHLCINDVNGARAAFEDEAMGWIRFFRSPRKHLEVWHPASYIGETGAAVGAIELIWGSAALELGFSPGPGILASASDAELRTAVFMRNETAVGSDKSHSAIRIGTGIPVLHADIQYESEPPDKDPGLHVADVDDLHGDLAQGNFDELSWLTVLRNYHHEQSVDPWADIEEFEQRLVAHLDALAWSGARARNLATEFLMSDEVEEVAAAAMVLLSFPLDQKVRDVIQDAIAESEERCQAIASVLPHMPRENAEPVLLSMASSGLPVQIGSAIRALAVAGWVSESTLRPHFHKPAPELAVPLVEAAGAAGFGELWKLVARLLEAYPKQFAGDDLFGALAICPRGATMPDLSSQQFRSRAPVAYVLNCLRDGTSFLDQRPHDGSLTPDALQAIGWSGEQEAKSLLLESLESGDDDQKSAAANALYRIFGCEQYEEVEVSVSEGPEEELAEETVEVKRLSQDRAVWEEALRAFDHRVAEKTRLRHGKPWRNQSALHHLKRSELAYKERFVAVWEYAIVNHLPLPLHPLWFVQRQKEALGRLLPEDS
jgi:3-oxoacyl-[acyl-carrier-protein] synthase-1